MRSMWMLFGVLGLGLGGCGYQAIEPGHRGLRYEPNNGGLKPEVLREGKHSLGWCFLRDCGRIEDYDITYKTQKETIFTPSAEGLAMDVKAAVLYRPVVTELYQLHSEIGQDYYEQIVGPELRSAVRSTLAHHSYTTLAGNLGKIEEEMADEVRKRIRGKHVELAKITLEHIKYSSPEIAAAVEKRLVAQQEGLRQKAAIEAEAVRKKTQLELDAAQAKLQAETSAEQARTKAQIEAEQARLKAQLDGEQAKAQIELELLKKQNERKALQEQLTIEKIEAEVKSTRARGAAQERIHLARAKAEENRAETLATTPLTVQAASYEALGKLGGNGTTIFLGDWSRAPQFLWPRAYGGTMPVPVAPASTSPVAGGNGGPAVKPAALDMNMKDWPPVTRAQPRAGEPLVANPTPPTVAPVTKGDLF